MVGNDKSLKIKIIEHFSEFWKETKINLKYWGLGVTILGVFVVFATWLFQKYMGDFVAGACLTGGIWAIVKYVFERRQDMKEDRKKRKI